MNRWGNHAEKIILLPYLTLVVGLVYFGVPGLRQLQLVVQSDALAKESCKPLADMHSQCRTDFQKHIDSVSLAVGGRLRPLLEEVNSSLGHLGGLAENSCVEVGSLSGQCESVYSISSLVDPQQFQKSLESKRPKMLGAAEKAVSHGEARIKQLQSAVTLFFSEAVNSLDKAESAVCGASHSFNLTKACASAQKQGEQVTTKIQGYMAQLHKAGQESLDTASTKLLQELKRVSHEACPELEAIPESCDRSEKQLLNAFDQIGSIMKENVPDFVPEDLLESALQSLKRPLDSALRGTCSQADSLVHKCVESFDSNGVNDIMQTLGHALDKLQIETLHVSAKVSHDSLHSLSMGCKFVQRSAASSCKEFQHFKGILKSRFSNVQKSIDAALQAGDPHAALSKFDKSWNAILDDMPGTIQKGLTDLNSWGHVAASAEACKTLLGTLTEADSSPCKQLNVASLNAGSMLATARDGLDTVLAFNGSVHSSCDKLQQLHITCVEALNPGAFLTKGLSGVWAHRLSALLKLEACLLAAGFGMAFLMLIAVRGHAELIVKLSVALSLSGLASLCAVSFMFMLWLPGITSLILLLFKCCWLWYMWDELLRSAVLIQCGCHVVEELVGCTAWVLGLMGLCLQVCCLALGVGAAFQLTSPAAPAWMPPGQAPWLVILATFWAVESIANTLLVTLTSSLGGCCGVETPGGSGICGSLLFSLVGACGSIVCGSLLVAILKVLQYILHKMEKNSNVVCRAMLVALCCLFEMMLKLYNSYAFVFVGLEGEGYISAAPKTLEVFQRAGSLALTTDQALTDVLQLLKSVSIYVLATMAVFCGHAFGAFDLGLSADSKNSSWAEFIMAPLLCLAMAVVTAYATSLTLGRLLEAAICTLLVIRMDHHKTLKAVRPELGQRLSELLPESEETQLLQGETA